MSAVSRSAQFAKVHKVLKKHYKPAHPPADRPVVEHLLFACCLEDARYEAAEEAFAALVHTFFDWNEIRVTSLSELSEVMAALPDPRAAANRIKRILHGIFEESYSFDLEETRKKNLGPTVKWLEKIDGASKFSVAYVVQSALGGHSIPIDTGTMAVLRILDLVSEQDVAAGEVSGLERAVAKSKGIEFGSLLHQLGADYSANPYSPQVREILLQIEPTAEERFPRRRAVRDSQPEPAESAEPPKEQGTADGEAPPQAAPGGRGRKKKAEAGKEAKEGDQPAAPLPADEAKKPPAATKKGHAEPPAAEKRSAPSAEPGREKSSTEGLAKRKPR